MAINFPDNPVANVTTHTVGDVIYTFDGDKWVAAATPLTAPAISSPSVTVNNDNANRFTSETFGLSLTTDTAGNPASTRDAKISVTPSVSGTPTSDEVSSIANVSFSDSVTPISVNENQWSVIRWCGPPFNRYIAYATGGTTSIRWAWSADGTTWNTFGGISGAGTSVGPGFVYRSVDEKIYVMDQGRDTTYYTVSTVAQLLGGTNDGSIGYTTRPHDNNSYRGYLDYDPRNDRLITIRGGWDVANVYVTYMPFPSSLNNADWRACGNIWGNSFGSSHVVDNGTNSYYVGNTFPHDGNTRSAGFSVDLSVNNASVTGIQSTTNYNNYSGYPWHDPVNDRWYFNGYYHDSTSPTNAGGSMANYTGWTGNLESSANSVTYAHGFWSTQLQRNVVVGRVRPNAGDVMRACVWVSNATGSSWTRYDTTEALNSGVTSGWTYAIDAVNAGTHILNTNSTDFPKRFGTSVTLGQSATFPELTFNSDAGLSGFSAGQTITQGTNSGIVLEVDEAGSSMVIKTDDTFATGSGSEVTGPASTFNKGYLIFDSNGNVSDVTVSDPGWTRLNGTGPWTLTFPATFTGGGVPDTVLPANSSMTVEFRASSSTQGFSAEDTETATAVTPT